MSDSSLILQAHELMQRHRYAEALVYAEQAASGATSCKPVQAMLATILVTLDRPREAAARIGKALQLPCKDADALDGLAHASMLLGEHDMAYRLYRQAATLQPKEARFWYNVASSARHLGMLDAAEEACNTGIAADPGHYPAYLLRSEMRVQTACSNHVPELGAALTDPVRSKHPAFFLGYALAKELDDLGRYDEAFHWFSTASSSRRAQLSYDVAKDEVKIDRIIAAYADTMDLPPVRAKPAPHIFIVGLPRSGTTVLERVITGLAGTSSNGETENFSRALLANAPKGGGDVFERAARADLVRVAAAYDRLACSSASQDRKSGSIVEKLPMNVLYLGSIARALPEAALLLVRRDPLENCFAMYRTLFGSAYPFSYDFTELARYHAAFTRLTEHWKKTLGPRVLELSYEALVERPEETGRDVARFCQLPWQDKAIDIERNKTPSLTASSAQIRRPIYRTSLTKAQHYARHLEPLVEAVAQHCQR